MEKQMVDLSEFFQTKQQANDFSSRLATILSQMYQTAFTVEKVFSEQFGIEKKDKLLRLLQDNNINIDNHSAIKEFVTRLQNLIPTLPVVPITLAFEPNEKTLRLLSDWFLLNLKQHVLFDLTANRKLVAGAAITYNGKFLDLSIRPQIDDIIHKNLISQTTQPTNHQTAESLHLGR